MKEILEIILSHLKVKLKASDMVALNEAAKEIHALNDRIDLRKDEIETILTSFKEFWNKRPYERNAITLLEIDEFLQSRSDNKADDDNRKLLETAMSLKCLYKFKYYDYEENEYTVPVLLTEDRINRLLSDKSISEVVIIYKQ